MNLNAIAAFASAVTEEHELFLRALNGRYLQMVAPGRSSTPRDIIDLSRDAHDMRAALGLRVKVKATELVSALGYEFENPSESPAGALLREFNTAFQTVIALNVRTVTHTGRTGRADLGKMFNRALGAGMGELLLKKAQSLEFKVPDPRGRRWDANRFAHFLAREFAYRVMLTKQLADVQGDVAEVFYPDHDSDTMKFSISGATPDLPSFAELELTVFHPNSNAQVVPRANA